MLARVITNKWEMTFLSLRVNFYIIWTSLFFSELRKIQADIFFAFLNNFVIVPAPNIRIIASLPWTLLHRQRNPPLFTPPQCPSSLRVTRPCCYNYYSSYLARFALYLNLNMYTTRLFVLLSSSKPVLQSSVLLFRPPFSATCPRCSHYDRLLSHLLRLINSFYAKTIQSRYTMTVSN